MDLSRRLLLLLGAQTRTRVLPTLLIAGLVTCAIAIPLGIRALNADEPAADVAALVADTGPLDGGVVSGDVSIAFTGEDVEAVSFNLFMAGSDTAVYTSQDVDGPSFDLVQNNDGSPGSLDSTQLSNGAYELFVTMNGAAGEKRTAATFEVQNP